MDDPSAVSRQPCHVRGRSRTFTGRLGYIGMLGKEHLLNFMRHVSVNLPPKIRVFGIGVVLLSAVKASQGTSLLAL